MKLPPTLAFGLSLLKTFLFKDVFLDVQKLNRNHCFLMRCRFFYDYKS
jgi:hypothetical protein